MREHRFPLKYVASAAVVSFCGVVFLWMAFMRSSPKVVVQRPRLGEALDEWAFDAKRDARNLGLSDTQCDAAFPKLYTELDRAMEHLGPRSVRQNQIRIWENDEPYPHGQVHVLIYEGQMYIIDEKRGACDRARALAGLSNLYRAIIAMPDPTRIPNVEFIIDIEDTPTDDVPSDRIVWAWNRPNTELNTWIMPDFDGWAFPESDLGSYISFRARLPFYETHPFSSKIPKAVWRGAMNNPSRTALVDSARDKEWADVGTMGARMHMAEFCKYQFPVHTEGNAWSGRLRYLANCNSVSIIPPLNYQAHFYGLLVAEGPEQNHISVREDFSDLEEKIMYYKEHPVEAEQLARKSVEMFRDRYLTPAAEACYWRRLIRNWAEVQAFQPEAYEEAKDGFRRQRGIDWEIWVNPDPNFPIKWNAH